MALARTTVRLNYRIGIGSAKGPLRVLCLGRAGNLRTRVQVFKRTTIATMQSASPSHTVCYTHRLDRPLDCRRETHRDELSEELSNNYK